MWSDLPMVALSSVVSQEKNEVDSTGDPVALTGVLNRGRGVLVRPTEEAVINSYPTLNRLKAGQVIYSKLKAFEGSIAVVTTSADGTLASPEFPTFSVNSNAISGYLCQVFKHPKFWESLAASSKGMGGRRERLHPSDFRKVLIPLPALGSQHRIVDLLTSADSSVESLEVELAAARNVRRQLLINAVRGHTASPASNLVKLGDVAESQLGKMLNTSRQTGEGARPYLRAGNITGWGKLRLEDLKSMDFDESELDKFSVKTGDLLVTEGGDAGRCVVYAGEEALCFQNAIHRVRADKSKTSNEYLALVLEYLSVTRQLDCYCSTTTIKHLSSGSLKSIELCLPPLAVQQSAVANIKAATTLAEAVDSHLQQAKHLRDQLLHDLLSGAHTIPESYDRFLDGVPS